MNSVICLKQLVFSNWMSYGENISIVFDDDYLIQIHGNNMVGKSSIATVLEETLFGKNSKGIAKKDLLNRNSGAKYIASELHLSRNSIDYSIVLRREGAKTNLSFTRNGVEIGSHKALDTYKTIENVIGLSFKTFSNLIYQSATSSLSFLTDTDANRKKFLIDLLDLSMYDEYREIIKEKVTRVNKDLLVINTQLKTLAAWKLKHSDRPTDFLEVLEEPKHVDFSDLDILRLKIIKSKDINCAVAKNRSILALIMSLKDPGEYAGGVPEPYNEDDYQEASNNYHYRTKEAARLKGLAQEDICSRCGQPMTLSYHVIEEASSRYELMEAKTKWDYFCAEKAKLSLYVQHLKKQVTYEDSKERLEDKLTPEEQPIQEEYIVQLQNSYDLMMEDSKHYTDNVRRVVQHNAKAQEYNKNLEAFLEEASEVEESTQLNKSSLRSLTKSLGRLNTLAKVFGSRGLIGYKIQNLMLVVQDHINEYLNKFTYGRFQLSFELDRDKLSIIILDNSTHISIKSLSAGEQARVNISVLLAIRKVMGSICQVELNLLFLDEVMGVLDDEGKNTLVDILLKENELNTFFIAHGYEHPLVENIYIKKVNNISSMEKG